MTRFNATIIFVVSLLFLFAVGVSLRPGIFALSIEGEYRPHNKMQAVFLADQPSVRSVYRNESSANQYPGVRGEAVKAAGEQSVAILKKIDAYRSYCSWDFDQTPPRLYSLDVGFYFEEDKQGVHQQDITFYAPYNLPDEEDLVSDDGSIVLTKLPAQGWYIWEQGMGHESVARPHEYVITAP